MRPTEQPDATLIRFRPMTDDHVIEVHSRLLAEAAEDADERAAGLRRHVDELAAVPMEQRARPGLFGRKPEPNER